MNQITSNIKIREEPSYCHYVEAEPGGKPWFHDIKMLLQEGIYPSSTNSTDKRTLRKSAVEFF